jgi:gas vesicle protein
LGGNVVAFDILSFLAGVTAGAVAGALAAILHGLENTADLQERLRDVTREVKRIKSTVVSRTSGANGDNSTTELDALSRDLNEIHEEIRRMYKKGKN